MIRPRRSTRALARELLLSAGAVLGVLCLLAAVASIGFDVKPLIFRSGSMGPTIETGALGLARTVPGTELRPGDVVSVVNATGTRVTHRVASTTSQGEVTTLMLKGDANRVPDAAPYVVVDADRLFFHVNHVGYVISWLGGPFGTFLGGLLVGVLGMMALGRGAPPTSDSEPSPRRAREAGFTAEPTPRTLSGSTVRLRGGAVVSLMVVLALGSAVHHVPDTEARFIDDATATTSRFTTLTVPPPTISCGALSLLAVQITWPAVSGATGYSVVITRGGVTQAAVPANGTNSHTFGGTGLIGSGSVVVYAQRAFTSTTWISVASNARSWTITAGLLGVCS